MKLVFLDVEPLTDCERISDQSKANAVDICYENGDFLARVWLTRHKTIPWDELLKAQIALEKEEKPIDTPKADAMRKLANDLGLNIIDVKLVEGV